MPKTSKKTKNDTYFEKLESDIKSNQNTLSLILGALIVIVVGVLIFNYFNRQNEPQISPEGENNQVAEEQGDVAPENLPGSYTVKDGDTLYTIAEKYYNDGFKYNEIVTANNLPNENAVEVGQVLQIPRLGEAVAAASVEPEPSASPAEQAQAATPAPDNQNDSGTGGQEVKPGQPADTSWGPAIRDNTYTVAEGDWLSTIAARAYGDVESFSKIAQANNITNPDVITPGTVLKLPR